MSITESDDKKNQEDELNHEKKVDGGDLKNESKVFEQPTLPPISINQYNQSTIYL